MAHDRRMVIDIETKYTFDEVGGRGQFHKLGVTVAVVYDYSDQSFKVFQEDDLGQLENQLIDASLIIGFNHRKFDMAVLQPYMSTTLATLPLFDLLESLQAELGYRVGLDNVAQATLNIGKSASGLDAIEFYRTGRIQELIDYCRDDVRITRDVYEYGMAHGHVRIGSRDGRQTKKLAVDWSSQTGESALLDGAAQYRLF